MTTRKTTEQVLDVGGDAVLRIAERVGGPLSLALLGVAGIMKAAALAMRDHGKEVEEIIAEIKMPRKIDTSWRADIDAKLADKE